MVKPYYERESLTEDDLLNDQEFLNDAYAYLQARTGKNVTDKQERIDELMELMRVSQVNEISSIQNLTHVKSEDDRGKALMGKMFLAYDKFEGSNNPLTAGFWDKVLDYGEGLVTSPATIGASLLAVPTLGGSLAVRGGAQAGIQATNLAVRQLVKSGVGKFVRQQAIRSGKRAAAVEAPLGALTMGTEAATRRETGRKEFEDIDVLEETLLGGAIGAGAGGLLGAAGGAIAAKTRGFKGLQKLDEYFTAKEDRVKKGIVKREEYLKAHPEDEEIIDEYVAKMMAKTGKSPLDPEVTEAGRKQKRELIPWISKLPEKPRVGIEGLLPAGERVVREGAVFSLTPEVMKNASAAALEMIRKDLISKGLSGEELTKKLKTTRITEVLHTALKKTVDGDYVPVPRSADDTVGLSPWDEMFVVMREYGLSPKEFSQIYMAEVSDAARILQQQRAVSSQMEGILSHWGGKVEGDVISKFETMSDQLQFLREHQHKIISSDRMARELDIPEEYIENMNIFRNMVQRHSPDRYLRDGWRILKDMDKARLGLMTIQPATTIRNTVNGTARLAVFALDNLFHGAITGDVRRIKAVPRTLTTMLDPTEAQILKILFSEEMPETAAKLYRQMADIEAATLPSGKPSKMIQVSRWLNGVNTLSDNAFKRAIFFSELSTRVGKSKLMDAMRRGEFTEIPDIDTHISEAMNEALSFTYQRGFKSRGQGGGFWESVGHGFLKKFSNPGLSLLVPFPRFTANAIEFVYKHAPLVGLLDAPAWAMRGKFLGNSARKLDHLQQLDMRGRSPAGSQIIKAEKGTKEFTEELLKENARRAKQLKKLLQEEDAVRKNIPKRIANQLTGTAMLYGAIQLRAKQGPNAKWYEMYDEDTGEYRNAMAFYGPFAVYMLAADIILRSNDYGRSNINLVNPEQWEDTARKTVGQLLFSKDTASDFLKATAGPQFKTGMTADWVRSFVDAADEYSVATTALDPTDPNYESQLEKANSMVKEKIAEAMGNVAATLLVPMGAVRDVMAGFDPEEWQGMKATDHISPADLFLKKALRAVPIDREGYYFGLFSAKEGARFVPFEGEGIPSQDPIKATKRPDTETPQRREGIRRQFTGLGSPYTKNVLETELEIQGLKAHELFPRIPRSSQLTRVVREYYQRQVADIIIPYINSPVYQNTKSELKSTRLGEFIRENLDSPLNVAEDTLLYELSNLKRASTEYKKTEKKLTEALQIRFKKGKDAYRTEAIQIFKEKHEKSPDFNNINDVLKLIVYLKMLKNQP